MKVSKTYTPNPDRLKIAIGGYFISPTKVDFDSDPDNYSLSLSSTRKRAVKGRFWKQPTKISTRFSFLLELDVIFIY
ncbi:hypothetical protein [Dysgonomonas termitidis]|uniref:Uncharacterized protein n=1 Tax=Dysgonomonas termitidis TaxID=1516126 RepID=A0ABV9L342_9BACT